MRIGIITHYYKSKNYGGNLQAYALCRVLQKMGYSAEQIQLKKSKTLKNKILNLICRVRAQKNISLQKLLRKRNRAIARFNLNAVAHSKVYTEKNIGSSVADYDVFITGSDQVWHPKACCPAYLLDFVPQGKRKISYAASVAVDKLPKEIKEKYKKSLSSFDAVSVRERTSVDLLRDISPCPVIETLDPTLLLDRSEWEKITEENVIKEKYLFCFFLGDGTEARKTAAEFAKKHNLKIVTLPYLLGEYRECDDNFGDYPLYDVSPGMFLTLIRDAQYVFTDSFHASVFSLIFQKQFFVFNRKGFKSMNVRIYTLIDIFDVKERFCDDESKTTLEYIESLQNIEYNRTFAKYEEKKAFSIRFLRDNVSAGERKEKGE